jgi:hypothetical protein
VDSGHARGVNTRRAEPRMVVIRYEKAGPMAYGIATDQSQQARPVNAQAVLLVHPSPEDLQCDLRRIIR